MTTRSLAVLALASAWLAAGPALAAEPLTQSLPLGSSTAEVTVTYHDDRPTMIACTPEQVAMIGARSLEHLTTLLPVLGARTIARHDPAGSRIAVLLDAACYEGGFMGLGAYGRGDEKIALPYEESTDGMAWGPPKKPLPITGE